MIALAVLSCAAAGWALWLLYEYDEPEEAGRVVAGWRGRR